MGFIIIETTLLYIKYSKDSYLKQPVSCSLHDPIISENERKSKNFPPNPLNNVASELTKIIYLAIVKTLRHLRVTLLRSPCKWVSYPFPKHLAHSPPPSPVISVLYSMLKDFLNQ